MQLCERFGYDQERIEQQLVLVGLEPEDHQLVEGLHLRVIEPHATSIVKSFYDVVKQDERFHRVMARGFSLSDLVRKQQDALHLFGRDFDTEGYFESRLRIGVSHARARVPLDLYLGSYRVFIAELLNRVPVRDVQAAQLRSVVLKVSMLDLSLVGSTYHNAVGTPIASSPPSGRVAKTAG